MKSGLNRNLQYWFGISVFVLVVISTASYTIIKNLLESNRQVDHNNLIILKLEKVTSIMQDAETAQRGYILTSEKSFLQPYNGAYQRALDQITQAEQLTPDSRYQQYYAIKVKQLLLFEKKLLDSMIHKKQTGADILVSDLKMGKATMDELRSTITRMANDETQLQHIGLADLNKYIDMAPPMIIITSLFALIISFLFFVKISEDIEAREEMQSLIELKERETAAMNEELAATNEELSNLNEEYLASNEELHQSRQNLQSLNNELEERVKQRTEELQESEKKLRNIMDTIPQMAWTSTQEGQINFYNKRWFEYTGLNFEETKDWGWKKVIHPEDLQYNLDQLGLILKKGVGGEFEVRERGKDGSYRWHLVRMQPVRNENGAIRLWTGTATDIQELKRLQQQKDDFITIASHELKTPVTALKASLQFMDKVKNEIAKDKFADVLTRANKSVNKVTALIEGLLNVGKFTQGQFSLNKSTFNLMKAITECCNNIGIPLSVSISLTGDEQLEVHADAERIDQVLTNLINNAIKYTNKDQDKKISISVERSGHTARVYVADNGPGIPPEKVSYLFDRYFQVERDGNQGSGLGIGLYICSEIIKKHNGTIGVDSELDKGSTFWFTLPV